MQIVDDEADVVVFWGKTPNIEDKELLNSLANKQIIVIDPQETDISKRADLHIRIKERGDFFLAMLLCRFLCIYDIVDDAQLKKHTDGFEDFYELTQSIRIVYTLKEIEVDITQLQNVLDLVKDKKVNIIKGKGLYNHSDEDDVLSAIEALEVMLSLSMQDTLDAKYEFMDEHDCSLPLK